MDGGERRDDLAEVNDRVFVNNVSLGLYADAVSSPDCRAAKLHTLLGTGSWRRWADAEHAAASVAPAPARQVGGRRGSGLQQCVLASGTAWGRALVHRLDQALLGVAGPGFQTTASSDGFVSAQAGDRRSTTPGLEL